MKTISKKLGAIVLALAMCFSLTCVAFAADDDDVACTITVENSVGGKTYSAYKVFNATYNETTESVSYTIDSTSAWYDAVSEATDIFTLTETATSGTYQVTLAADVEDADVISFLNTTFESIGENLAAEATGTGNGGQLILEVEDAGYYYVTTTMGSEVSVGTAAPNATVYEKNNKPGTGGSDPKDPDWEGGFTKDADGSSYSIGDEVEYTIKSYVPSYAGSEEIDHYTITDTMGHGLTYDNDMKVTIIGTGLDDYEDITSFCKIETSTDEDDNTVLTVTWSPAEIEEATDYTYPADAVVTITYTDTVTEEADELDLHNDVALAWFRADGSQIEPDDPEDPPTADEDIYTYGFTLTKTDGTDQLEGAQFTLAGTDDTPIQFVEILGEDEETGEETVVGYEVYDAAEHTSGDVEPTTTITVGSAYVWGLGEGTYTLTETVAPNGYNLLSEPVTIVIASTNNGWTVTADGTTSAGIISASAEDGHGVTTMASVSVVNSTGSSLPSTGGMGTTIFYIIGGVLVAGAVVVLITRRRMSSAD